jgi:hypothetical protein
LGHQIFFEFPLDYQDVCWTVNGNFCEGGIRFYLFNFGFFLEKFFEIFGKKRIYFVYPPNIFKVPAACPAVQPPVLLSRRLSLFPVVFFNIQ